MLWSAINVSGGPESKGPKPMKRYVVFVEQIIVGGQKPFFFDIEWAALAFVEETGGTRFVQPAK